MIQGPSRLQRIFRRRCDRWTNQHTAPIQLGCGLLLIANDVGFFCAGPSLGEPLFDGHPSRRPPLHQLRTQSSHDRRRSPPSWRRRGDRDTRRLCGESRQDQAENWILIETFARLRRFSGRSWVCSTKSRVGNAVPGSPVPRYRVRYFDGSQILLPLQPFGLVGAE